MIWLVLLICVPAAFLLSGTGSALLNVSRVRARHAAEEGDRAAARLLRLLEQRNDLHHAVTVLHHFCALAAFAACVLALVKWLGPWGWAVVLVMAMPFFLVGLEFIPKLLFRRYPFRLLRSLARPLALLLFLARPWIALAHFIRNRALAAAPQEDKLSLQSLTETVTSLGVLSLPVCGLVQRTGMFQKMRASDLLMPLAQLTALPPDMPLTSAIALNAQPRHPWRAVLGPDGRLLGWLDMTSLPPKPPTDKLVRQFMRPLLQFRHDEPAFRCLQALRKRSEPVAAIVDASGEPVGVLTLQSLLTELLQIKAA